MTTREQLLKELTDWRTLDKFTAQEDVDYARQKIAQIKQQINVIDAADRPGHVCCKCKRTDEGNDRFLGFHQYRRDGEWEVCDNCAEIYGCVCCDVPGNYVILYDAAAR